MSEQQQQIKSSTNTKTKRMHNTNAIKTQENIKRIKTKKSASIAKISTITKSMKHV